LSTILAYLEYVTDDWKKTMARHDAQRKIREEEERVILEARQKEQLEREKFRNLLRDANRWHQAEIMSEYIHEVEVKAINRNSVSENLMGWIRWAIEKVDKYDPLINKFADYWVGIDKYQPLNSQNFRKEISSIMYNNIL
jgi:vacuolar-type H+-ATPase subunit I/STV1